MSKRLESKYGVCKKLKSRYKNLWGLKKKKCHSIYTKQLNKKFRKITRFGKLLNVKQTLKFFYSNVNESLFKNVVKYSIYSSSKATNKFIGIHESRIDSILFRSCFVKSFHEARQLINHSFVFVNNFKVINHCKRLYKGDFIKLNKISLKLNFFKKIVLSRSIPTFLEIDFKNQIIIFLWDPKKAYYPIKVKKKFLYKYYKQN